MTEAAKKWDTGKENNGGFTLVELLVSIMILLIVSTAIFSFMNAGSRFFYRANVEADMQSEAQIMKNQMNDLICDTGKGLRYYDAPSAATGLSNADKCLIVYGEESIAYLAWNSDDQKVYYLEKGLDSIAKDADSGVYSVTLSSSERDVRNWSVLSEYVKGFSCDLSQVTEDHQIFSCKMDYENRTADYSTTHTITLRNQIFNDSDLETMYDDYIYTEEDKITDITLSPTMVDARPGETVTFSYAVSASGSTPDRSVTFSVQNNTSANTTIDGSGVLTIGADETASSLTVICQSNSDTSISRTAVVNIAKVTAVALTTTDLPPYEDMYYFPGAELNFTASVEGNYITETGKSVTWSISDEKNSAKITASTGNSCTVDVGDAIDQTITLTATSVLDRTVSASYIIRVADIDTGALYVRSDTGFFTLKRDGSLQLSAYINDDSVTSSGVTFTWEIVDDPTGGKVSINDNGYLTAEKNIPYDKSYSVRVKVTANSTSSSQTEVTAEVTVTIDKVEISFTPASAIVVVGSTTRVTTEVKGLNVDMKEISITYKPAVKGFSALMSSNGTLVLGEEKKYKDTAVVTASLSNGGKVTADLTVHFRESNIIVDGQNGCYAPVPGDGGLFPDGDDDGIPDATTSIDIKGVTYTYVLEANNKWYLTVNGVKYNYNKNSTTDIKYVKAK